MNQKPLAAIALVLIFSFVAPAAFFAAAPRAHAIFGAGDTTIVIGETSPTAIARTAETAFSAVHNAITAVSSITSAIGNYALMINKYILEPIAFIVSGQLLKAITASVIQFVNGQANGTGIPQFVQNLRGHLQSTGDTQALSFLIEFGRNSDSPFASAISSSLRNNYLEQTSLAGFFAANRDTLPQFSQSPNAFIAGDWSQGGASAWFALSTRGENNPYILHERAQRELATLVYDASNATLADLSFGNGFFSWCGSSRTQDVSAENQGGGINPVVITPEVQSGTAAGDGCVNNDGTPGFVQTPGSAIHDQLTKVLGIDIDKLVGVGSIASDISGILGNVATVMNTLSLASSILGGGGSGGLYGASQPYNGARSALQNYQSPDYLGLTTQNVQQSGNNAIQSYTASANAAANNAVAEHDRAVASSSSSGSTAGGGKVVNPIPPANPIPLP